MVTEQEYTKALNARSWSYVLRKTSPAVLSGILAITYAFHCKKHMDERTKTFSNKSKIFGGLKNPQY